MHVNTHTGQKNMMHALYRHTTQDQTVSVWGGASVCQGWRSRDRIRKHVRVFAHVPWADPSGSGSHLLVPCEPRG